MSLALKRRLAQQRQQQINVSSAPPGSHSNLTGHLDHPLQQTEHSAADNIKPADQNSQDQHRPSTFHVDEAVASGTLPHLHKVEITAQTTTAPAPLEKPALSSRAASAHDLREDGKPQAAAAKQQPKPKQQQQQQQPPPPKPRRANSLKRSDTSKSQQDAAAQLPVKKRAKKPAETKDTNPPPSTAAAVEAGSSKPVVKREVKPPPSVPVLVLTSEGGDSKQLGLIEVLKDGRFVDFKTFVEKKFPTAFTTGKPRLLYKDSEGDWLLMNTALPWRAFATTVKQVMIVQHNMF